MVVFSATLDQFRYHLNDAIQKSPGLKWKFYHTLNYDSEVELQNRIDAAREALRTLKED